MKTLEQYDDAGIKEMFDEEPGLEDASLAFKIRGLKDKLVQRFKKVRGSSEYKAIKGLSYKVLQSDAHYDLRTERLFEAIQSAIQEALDCKGPAPVCTSDNAPLGMSCQGVGIVV